MNYRRLFFALIVVCLFGLTRTHAQSERTLRVAIKPIEPLVFVDGELLTGFSIDLWNALATDMDVRTEWVVLETVNDILTAVETGEADVAIAGISITAEREERLDFSLPMFASGLQILVPATAQAGILGALRTVFSPLVVRIVLTMVVVLVIMAHIVWFVDRHENSDFHEDYLHGIWEAFYWSVVTLTTVGYGDKVPRTVGARLAAMVWMVISMFLVAYFTASVTTTLTLQGLSSRINSVNDLPGNTVGTVRGTTSADFLANRRIRTRHFDTIDAAYIALDAGSLDAIVYDAPVLQYYVVTEQKGRVVGSVFQAEDYGIAVPTDSPLREEINQSLLRFRESGGYDGLLRRWFGGQGQ